MNAIPLESELSNALDNKRITISLSLFLAITFIFTWSLLGLAFLSANQLIAFSLPSTMMITIATLGPALGAIAAAAYVSGRMGVRALLAQTGRWRVGGKWFGVALIGPALVMVASFLLWRVLGGPTLSSPPTSTWASIPVLLVVMLIPALFEEVGWRGYALPRLQSRYGWLLSSLILGVIWAVWHAPIWFIPEAGFSSLPFPIFLLFTTALSLLMTWLYNRTGGSVLLPAMAHAAINAYPLPWNTAVFLLPESARGLHLQIPVTIVLIIAAIVLVIRTGRTISEKRL